MLGNYFLEIESGNYQAKEASGTPNTEPDLLRFSRVDEFDCKIVDLVSYVVFDSSIVEVDSFWALYFDGSKTLQGSGAGCVLIDPRKINIFFLVE